ncbi:WbqC family protein [Rhodocytophaga aerolata]|uniref:WbqC family protein n=1 Tax=Rhodocytophaga aerolata TaxID=455078 RepID=A0ABT8RDW7_9BACT|nr:WbqC family protein [Rhodocytophaga aerolata]MDO1450299.1 WbqC family protein [Rhodocytophaga aerolata]
MPAKSAVVELQYLPCLEYFACLLKYDTVYIEAHEHYQKQSYRNRCHILTATKVAILSVPIVKGNSKQLIRDVQIDYTQKWLTDHWRTIYSAYGKAPFFEHYADFFERVYVKKYKYLFDLNLDLLTNCLSLLKVNKKINFTDSYKSTEEIAVKDFRSAIHPKSGDKNSNLYTPVRYRQNFGNNFVSNLSIIDVLFCEGPRSLEIIRQSVIL